MPDLKWGSSAYDFSLDRLGGGRLDLESFKGRPLVIVNTASQCGFTPQYKGLQKLWEERRHEGLVVIGVPSNQFGNQEPGGAGEIAQFCEVNFGVDFPLAAKAEVKGKDAHPLFRWIAAKGGFFAKPRWNFYKYLIDREGQLVTWFASTTSPDSSRFRRAIDRILKA